MTIDDKPKALPLPSMNGAWPDARGGPSEHALGDIRRRVEAHAAAPQAAIETAEAAARRQLINEIRMMRRYRLNAAIEGVIKGVLYTGAAWGLYHVGRWILDELRRPPSAPPPPPPAPSALPQPSQLADSRSAGRTA